jgi:nucleoside-diphosphate-sugar epimerase
MHRIEAAGDRTPSAICSEDQLEETLSQPRPVLLDFIRNLDGPLVILGAGGKMGPTLATLAMRAARAANHSLEVFAVSRFKEPRQMRWFVERGIKAISCDLLQSQELGKLPDASNIIYLVGLKFGTTQNPAATWAANTLVPPHVLQRYPRARIVALSTGNVYPLSSLEHGGSKETDALTPLGEYANAAVARERIFEYCSGLNRTPVALLRLFYAVELRYGVLVDLARKVHQGETIPLANGHFNCVWQADANELVLRSLALTASPPSLWNLCRPEIFSTRAVAVRLGELLGREPRFAGSESPTALLGNSSRLCAKLGLPPTTLETMLGWIAQWVKQGGRDLGKPTHFEVRDGNY